MASIRDTLANLVEQYKESDTPLANLMRGDKEGAKQSVANALQQATLDPYSGLNVLGTTKLVGKTAQELAHATAQKNAAEMLGLHPENTAMERAKAMGFDIENPVYHGTRTNIEKIDPSKFGKSTETYSGESGFWTTSDPHTANSYANYAAYHAPANRLGIGSQEVKNALPNRKQNILPLYLNKTNLLSMDAKGKSWGDYLDDPNLDTQLTNFLDTVNQKNALGEIKNFDDVASYMQPKVAHHYVTPDPSLVRSRFAAFDPARANEPDLLAGAMAIPIATDKDKRNRMIELLKNK
jgi:hypothetical protein